MRLRSWAITVTTKLIIACVKLGTRVIGHRRLFEALCSSRLVGFDYFVTYNMRPKRASEHQKPRLEITRQTVPWIVMQGPMILDEDFTLETLRLYKARFPKSEIIVSTWVGEPEHATRQIEKIGAKVIFSAKPSVPGHMNTNLQIVSSAAGILAAAEEGAAYILKTRSDQRLYSPDALEALHQPLETFRIGSGSNQEKRVVACSFNTFKYRLYGVSDMLIYGATSDLKKYWNINHDLRHTGKKKPGGLSLGQSARERSPEVYFATQFLLSLGRKLEWTLEDSWRAFGDHFCVVDKETVDLFWPKYTAREDRFREYTNSNQTYKELRFFDWLELYHGLCRGSAPEFVLDLPVKGSWPTNSEYPK